MDRKTLLFILTCLTLACTNPNLETDLAETKAALQKSQADLAETQQALATLGEDAAGSLGHIVFFKLKPDVDVEAFIREIKKLEAIDGLQDLEVGPFKDLGDARALADFSMLMEMTFDDVAAYEKYQTHPVHLALKEKTKAFLAGPPVTYDFIKQ